MSLYSVRPMRRSDIPAVVQLQRECFPPPFPEDLLWQPQHLEVHLRLFPQGQWVCVGANEELVGSASSLLITEEAWHAHQPWEETVGGFFFENHNADGSTLFGADISVSTQHRKNGVGRALYEARFQVVRDLELDRYGTACRMPGYQLWSAGSNGTILEYAQEVVSGNIADRTLTPLLRFGLRFMTVLENHMEDEESGHAAAVLEWTP